MRYLLRLPWTIRPETTPEGDRLLRVAELPAAVGTGVTDEQLVADFWESLEATLETYVEHGDDIPLPAKVATLPWVPIVIEAANPVAESPGIVARVYNYVSMARAEGEVIQTAMKPPVSIVRSDLIGVAA